MPSLQLGKSYYSHVRLPAYLYNIYNTVAVVHSFLSTFFEKYSMRLCQKPTLPFEVGFQNGLEEEGKNRIDLVKINKYVCIFPIF